MTSTYSTLYNKIVGAASNGGQTTRLRSASVTSHLQKCVFVHEWHLYTFRLEQLHATITQLVH